MLGVGRQESGKLNLSRSKLFSGAIKYDVCYTCALTLAIKSVSISNQNWYSFNGMPIAVEDEDGSKFLDSTTRSYG